MKRLKSLSKKDKKFVNYRASYCNPRNKQIKGISKEKK